MDIYAENILDHYRHPRGTAPLDDVTVEHREMNLTCGDELTLRLKLHGGSIEGLSWNGTGCAISQAGMSLLSEEMTGKSMGEAQAIGKKEIHALLGVPVGPRRMKCALLCLHTLKNALRKAEGLPPQGWLDTVELADD